MQIARSVWQLKLSIRINPKADLAVVRYTFRIASLKTRGVRDLDAKNQLFDSHYELFYTGRVQTGQEWYVYVKSTGKQIPVLWSGDGGGRTLASVLPTCRFSRAISSPLEYISIGNMK